MISDKPDEFVWPATSPPSAAVDESIRRVCTGHLVPRKPVTAIKRVALAVLISGSLFATLLAIGWMRHPPKDAVALALLGALAWGIIQASVLFVGHGKPPGRRGTKLLRWAAVLAVPAVFVLHLTLTASSLLTFSDFLVVQRSVRSTVVCGVHSLLFGAAASVVLFVLWRRTDPFSPHLTGALTGLAGGMVGAVALDMTCPNSEAWHLWLGHGLALVAFVVAGWFAGRRWLAP
ncbi:MAG TPA: NrsF family protein [Polyangiaceae bacterium]